MDPWLTLYQKNYPPASNNPAQLKPGDPELQEHNGFLYNLSESEADQLSRLLDKIRG